MQTLVSPFGVGLFTGIGQPRSEKVQKKVQESFLKEKKKLF
jgi:hypothetical protein